MKKSLKIPLLSVALVPFLYAGIAWSETGNRMLITGTSHGYLFDREAQKQAGPPAEITDYLWGMQDQLTTWRRGLHKIPEIGHKEVDTNAYLKQALKDMGYEPRSIGPSTGLMVDIPGEDSRFTIGVRADIDGLPITEVDDGREYRSTKEGYMHACGHDNHTAIVLGVAKAYADGKFKPPSNIRLIFQPAEETGTGAAELVKAGVLKGVDVIIGLHSDPTREWGTVGLAANNNFSAFATGFTFEVTGKAAHGGAAHHEGKDAIVAGSYIVTQLQTLVSRDVAAADAAVVSVGVFTAGQVANQIADKAVMWGTTRAESREIHEMLKQRLADVAKGTEVAMGMPVKLDIVVEAPGVVNNPAIFDIVRSTSVDVLGEANVDVYTKSNMGGEDFSYYTEKIPGFYYWLGTANTEKGITAGLHTPEFDADERALVVGTALQLANIDALHEFKQSGGEF